jgi:hypothetical protein
MKKLNLAILGMGASALYAKSAIENSGVAYELDIYNLGDIRISPGAFWLRLLPEGLAGESIIAEPIHIEGIGSKNDYTLKQWGRVFPSSFPEKERIEYGYNPLILMTRMFNNRSSDFNVIKLDKPLTDVVIADSLSDYDLVFQTFPTDKAKKVQGKFIIKTPFSSEKISKKEPSEWGNKVVYFGSMENPIVRTSLLFGYLYREYVSSVKFSKDQYDQYHCGYFPDLHPETPEWDIYDVPADNVVLLGRYAEWSRKVLSHEAYQKTLEILKEIA